MTPIQIMILSSLVGNLFFAFEVKANEWPLLQQGLWSFQVEIDGQKATIQSCTKDPVELIKTDIEKMKSDGCKVQPVKKANIHQFSVVCPPTGRSDYKRVSSAIMRLVIQGDSAYKFESTGKMDAKPWRSSIEGRRVGGC